jgi:AcrR family transcriptional regulator
VTDAKTSRRELYAAMTKAAILAAAKRLFVEHGFDATSVDDIARESQVSKGAVYHHFQDKREVFAQVYREVELAVVTAVATVALRPDLDPWQRVVEATRACLQSYVADPDARALLREVSRALGQERARELDEELALPPIRALLEELHRVGELHEVNIRSAALLVFRMLSEAAMAIADAADPDEAARDLEPLCLYMFAGLRTPAATQAGAVPSR